MQKDAPEPAYLLPPLLQDAAHPVDENPGCVLCPGSSLLFGARLHTDSGNNLALDVLII